LNQITVMQSFPRPKITTNPYLILLQENLAKVPGVTVLNFSWRQALLGRYDVFHVHWPEILVDGNGPAKKLARQLLTVALLARLAIRRIPLVRTVHNIALPQGISRREAVLLKIIDKATNLRIRLTDVTEVPSGSPVVTIPHGHYRSWFSSFERRSVVPGQIGFAGLIRRYKGVEDLVRVFNALKDPTLTLQIAGKPSTAELRKTIESLAAGDARIHTAFGFLSDGELVDIITSSELIVLPYRTMHNSGSALASLSLDRPVLVPASPVTERLSREVGDGWMFLFNDPLSASTIEDTLEAVRSKSGTLKPDLSLREWDAAATLHAEAYCHAIRSMQRGL
jgi:glycosyltransferase involved in cell wall biosynthesis